MIYKSIERKLLMVKDIWAGTYQAVYGRHELKLFTLRMENGENCFFISRDDLLYANLSDYYERQGSITGIFVQDDLAHKALTLEEAKEIAGKNKEEQLRLIINGTRNYVHISGVDYLKNICPKITIEMEKI